LAPIPSRRWILSGAWDRLQIPKPFCRIDAYFAEPIEAAKGETDEHFRQRIERTLYQLERSHDSAEASPPVHRSQQQAA
ncbi:MAG: hypothetical protein ACR2NZ_11445, partial [Rubripirellula sp.]